ncbi:hypothetical protein [Pseudomonas gingeri]
MLRNRWDEAREKAAEKVASEGYPVLAAAIRQPQLLIAKHFVFSSKEKAP